MSRNWILLLSPLLLVLGLGFIFLAGILGSDKNLPSQFIGKQSPRIELKPVGDFDLPISDDLQQSGVKVVNFWASWCVPCRAEHPSLEEIEKLGIPIYGVNYKDLESNAVNFLSELGNPFEKIGADPSGRNAIEWGVYGIPETFIIDNQGRVTYRLAGPITNRFLVNEIIPEITKAKEVSLVN